MMTQTLALLLDAYRELNARKLFWVTLGLSVVVVAAFAAAGLNQQGFTFLWWDIPSARINTRVIPRALLYKHLFVELAIPIWLAWVATTLALVSTAGIIPDFVAGGAIELSLSRPISRVRLLLSKFASALLFTLLQVGAFTGAAFLVIGLRGDAWEPRLFLAIPIMVLFFSYLYAVCLLLGLITRSTIASLMLTLLLWLGLIGVTATETVFRGFRERNTMQAEWLADAIERLESAHAEDAAAGRSNPRRESALEQRREQLAATHQSGAMIRRGYAVVAAVRTIAPKTQETRDLLNRTLLSSSDRDVFLPPADAGAGFNFAGDDIPIDLRELERRVQESRLNRSVPWVLGTSLAFEIVVLAFGCWVFARRDF